MPVLCFREGVSVTALKLLIKLAIQAVQSNINFIIKQRKLMGSCISEDETSVKVATLNYSGILKSPFEFYSLQSKQDQESLNKIFIALMAKHEVTKQEGFKWQMGPIDKKIQQERYAPIYRKGTGVENGKFVSRAEFQTNWNKHMDQRLKKKSLECTEAEKNHCRIFDMLCLETIVMHAYQVQSYQQALQKSPEAYLKICENFFGKAFINEGVKIVKTLEAIQKLKLDVIFLQETSEDFIKHVSKLVDGGVFLMKDLPDNESVILIRRQKFIHCKESTQEMLQKLSQEQIKKLNWNNDTAFMFLDKLILISSHISSKSAKNIKQIEEVYKDLTMLSKTYPHHRIILGFDANTEHLDPEKITPEEKEDFDMVPRKIHDYTCSKKRTIMQPQLNKADVISCKRSDYILTNAKISNQSVSTIAGRQINSNEELLPSNEHPFDHFLVVCTIKIT